MSTELPTVDALMPHLGTDDPVFNAWRDSIPDKHWTRLDLSALRIGYELGKAVHTGEPRCPDCGHTSLFYECVACSATNYPDKP